MTPVDGVVAQRLLDEVAVEDRAAHERHALGHEARVAARQIVDDDRGEVRGREGANDVSSDIAGTAGHKPGHGSIVPRAGACPSRACPTAPARTAPARDRGCPNRACPNARYRACPDRACPSRACPNRACPNPNRAHPKRASYDERAPPRTRAGRPGQSPERPAIDERDYRTVTATGLDCVAPAAFANSAT